MTEQLALLPEYLTAHLRLSLFALLPSIGLSVPLGVVASRVPWFERSVLGAASVVQTIPSLALLAVMVPLLAAVGAPSIGFLPAFAGLVLYGMLPVLRNTVTGLAGVDPAYREAARGVGMTDSQRLLRVELPLALPVIIAGVRTATVWTVGMATLSTPVGATSLGNYIFGGLQTRNASAVLLGCAAAAVLALFLDALVRVFASGWHARRRGRMTASLAALLALYVFAGAGAAASWTRGGGERELVVGTKTFTEQYVLGELLAARIARETGRSVRVAPSLGSTVAFDALRSGDIDVYVDYSGTLWATVLARKGAHPARATLLEQVREDLAREHGITLVAALGFENTYALAMRTSEAERLGIRRIGDLAPHAKGLAFGGDYEFFARPEWRALQERYALSFEERRAMDVSLLYQAVAADAIDVACVFSTDGRIRSYDLVVLEDDRAAIPPYDAVILASARLARDEPDVLRALAGLAGAIDADEMRRMNLAVDQDARSPADVASEFLATLRE